MSSDKSRTYNRAKREYGVSHDCDICGKQNATGVALIEGARMAVCPTCTKFGKILHSIDLAGKPAALPSSSQPEEVEDIAEGYGKTIKNAREKLGLSIQELANRMMERENYLEKIEKEELLPSLNISKKLEKMLSIKLVEKSKMVHAQVQKGEFRGFTMADVATDFKTKKK